MLREPPATHTLADRLLTAMKRLLPPALLGIALLLAPLGARAEEAAAPGPVVELPKFVVTDNRELPPPESWQYGTFPGFEVLSNASVKNTQNLVKGFETFRLALSYVWPVPDKPAYPVSLIICGRGGKFDAFVPKGSDADATMARASLFLKQGDRSAIVIDFQAKELTVLAVDAPDPTSGEDASRFSVDHDKQLYREYVRYLLSQTEPRLPAWFEEGLTQIIIAMKIDPTLIQFGVVEDPNTISVQAAMNQQLNALAAGAGESTDDSMLALGAPAEDRDFNAALRRKPLIAMPKFLSVAHNDPIAVNPLGTNIWAKQAYAFVHMCLFGRGGKFKRAFSQFLIRSTREPVTEELFKECFRIPKSAKNPQAGYKEYGYKDILLELRSYCDSTDYSPMEFRAKKGERLPMPKPMALRDATQSEVGRIKGEALILAGEKTRARAELIAPYIRGERDPQLLTALAVYDRNAGEDDRARKLLDYAVANKATGPDAYYELAKYRFADATAKPAGPNNTFSAAQTKGIIDLLLQARKQPPPIPSIYELMADTWIRRGEKSSREELGTLVDGLRMFPGRMRLAYETGVLARDAGDHDLAHAMADHGLKYAFDANGKARFQQLKASLPPATAPAAK